MTFKRYFLFLLAGALLMFGTFFVGRGAGRFLSPQPVKAAAEETSASKEAQPTVDSEASSEAEEEKSEEAQDESDEDDSSEDEE